MFPIQTGARNAGEAQGTRWTREQSRRGPRHGGVRMRRSTHLTRRAATAAVVSSALMFAVAASAQAEESVTVKDLNNGPTAAGLAESLAGSGVAVSNVVYTGS